MRFVLFLLVFSLFAGSVDALIAQEKTAPQPSELLSLEGVLDPNSDIPPELLAVDYRLCFEGCEKGGLAKNTCSALCACSIREFQKRYVNKSYIAVRAQISLNAVDEANRIILDSIGAKCAGEANKAGLLPPAKSEGDEKEAEPKPASSKPDDN